VDEAAAWAPPLAQDTLHDAAVQQWTASFAPEPDSASAARHWALDALKSWDPRACSADVQLVISELVTNAVVYGAGTIRVNLGITDGAVHIAVTDHGAQAVVPWVPSVEEVHGRGLWIVDRLARKWGVTDHDLAGQHHLAGKTVWAEMTLHDG
jgi:anti-sigma regulatory factor (Ser/Thr protein kinase)